MLNAELGDDEYGDDPTVNRLEALAAVKLGKEAALFTVSGTMSNLVAILTHCKRGDELIVGDQSHIFLEEGGGASGLGNVHIQTLPNGERGTLDPDEVEQAIRPDDPHDPPTGLIALENTHTYCGGSVLTQDEIGEVASVARRHGSPSPCRRCADIQRLGLSGDSDLRAGEGCGLGELLPIQGTVLPHRLDALRQRRVHPAGPILAGDSGWRDEAGGSYRRRGHRGTGEHDRTTGRRPLQRPTPGSGPEPSPRHRHRPGEISDQPGLLQGSGRASVRHCVQAREPRDQGRHGRQNVAVRHPPTASAPRI